MPFSAAEEDEGPPPEINQAPTMTCRDNDGQPVKTERARSMDECFGIRRSEPEPEGESYPGYPINSEPGQGHFGTAKVSRGR